MNPSDSTVVHKRKKAPFSLLLLVVILSQLCWEIYMFGLGEGEIMNRGDVLILGIPRARMPQGARTKHFARGPLGGSYGPGYPRCLYNASF